MPHFRIPATCLHWIEDIADDNETCTATYVTNMRDATLLGIINGHRVNGLGLFPSSLYTGMALTAAHHLYRNIQGLSAPGDISWASIFPIR